MLSATDKRDEGGGDNTGPENQSEEYRSVRASGEVVRVAE